MVVYVINKLAYGSKISSGASNTIWGWDLKIKHNKGGLKKM